MEQGRQEVGTQATAPWLRFKPRAKSLPWERLQLLTVEKCNLWFAKAAAGMYAKPSKEFGRESQDQAHHQASEVKKRKSLS